ncbi:MAG: polyprenyl synthetase family protein [Alphaproteobacteria bacterium]|nr:polyprenyl synthetase family protein [Alphaproteobacteria bacterium]
MQSLDAALQEASAAVIGALSRYIPVATGAQARLFEAMRYSTFAGGKRLRPFLVLAGADLFGVPRAHALPTAAAIEMVHTYSLVHDDLPAMDNDDLRRGQPTCHKKFDEATAILTGDSLLTLAFEAVAASSGHPDAAVRANLVHALAIAAGAEGMAGGQMIDLDAEKKSGKLDLDAIIHLQRLKTGALIRFSCEAGAIMARAGDEARRALRTYASCIGLAFQITDDLLDHEGTTAELGKAAGKDAKAGKATFVQLLGAGEARRRAHALVDEAEAVLAPFGPKNALLRQVARYIVERRS